MFGCPHSCSTADVAEYCHITNKGIALEFCNRCFSLTGAHQNLGGSINDHIGSISGITLKEQVLAAPFIEKTSVRPISIAYIVISTSRLPTAIERSVKLDIIRHENIKKVLDYALAAQYFGMSCVYLEAGSGADNPVPVHMIKAVKNKIKVPLIIGGGIRNAEQAKNIAEAGANVLVTGTIAEQNLQKLEGIIAAIKSARPKK